MPGPRRLPTVLPMGMDRPDLLPSPLRLLSSISIGLSMCVAVACVSTPDTYLNDTWTWDGGNWHQTNSGQVPGWRFGAVYVYDAASKDVVLFGGEAADGRILADTWTWDGHWTRRHPLSSPPARHGPAAAYDPVSGKVVMFGGQMGANYGDLADTWVWDGLTWSPIITEQAPHAQWFRASAAAFDPLSKEVVLVQSLFSAQSPGTWTWNGKTWTLHPPSARSSVGSSTGLVYTDSSRGRAVVLGDPSVAWDGSTWTPLVLPRPVPFEVGDGIAFDSQVGSLISFGGNGCSNSATTWAMDETAWHQLKPKSRPKERAETYLSYDSSTNQVVMFGGWVKGQCSGGAGTLP